MTQAERRIFLIRELLAERPQYGERPLPAGEAEQRRLLRGLLNTRPPRPANPTFLRVQDEYLRREIQAKGVTDYRGLSPRSPGLYLWRGDITTLRCGAIVNAANGAMTGCYQPNHLCIDNAIHTFAGVQLRLECAEIIERQGHDEPVGQAKITGAYNLPCQYVLHTVGPIVNGEPASRDEALLAGCYRACLALAEKRGVSSVAFCCVSTGVFRFPHRRAAEVALAAVRAYKAHAHSQIEVIFNVFNDQDYQIYRELLG